MQKPPTLHLKRSRKNKQKGFDLKEKKIESRDDYLEFVRYLLQTQRCLLGFAVRLIVRCLPRPSSVRLKHVEAENRTPGNI